MIRLIKKVFVISAIIACVTPILMWMLWDKYVSEQEIRYGSEISERKACEPYEFSVIEANLHYKFNWKTRQACTGFLLLGRTFADFSNLPHQVFPASVEEKSTVHSVSILAKDGIQYTYGIIVSDGEWYGLNNTPFAFKETLQLGK